MNAAQHELTQRKLILFDFDGTLADTARDLAAAANRQRERQQLAPLPFEALRPVASQGARGMLRVALGLTPEHAGYEASKQQFLTDYEACMHDHVALFDGIALLLDTLTAHGHAWGIVTNKLAYLAIPLIRQLGLEAGSAAIVGGDTTPHVKPHPAPLLHAAQLAGFAPERCLYVGDDERDILAGKAANMATIAVAYGYAAPRDIPNWQADAVAQTPHDIWPALKTLGVQMLDVE